MTCNGLPHGATGDCLGVDGPGPARARPRRQLHRRPGRHRPWTFEGGTNYTDQDGSVEIVINQATLEVDAVANSKTYGEDDPAFTYQLSGFVNDEDAPRTPG